MSEQATKAEMPNFELIANLCVEEGVQLLSPAELHGVMVGHLAAGARLEPSVLLQTACELMDINSLSHESSKVTLLELYTASCQALESLDLEFELLLPDDDNEIAQRAEALGRWCQSFLSGFGLYGKHTDASLSSEAKETLNDLGQIAQISTDLEELDEHEADLMEVQEYVRMAALMLFTECNQAVEEKVQAFAQAQSPSERLH